MAYLHTPYRSTERSRRSPLFRGNHKRLKFLNIKNMITAEIITIGTEIVLGQIVDTNTPYIAQEFVGKRNSGTVPDVCW